MITKALRKKEKLIVVITASFAYADDFQHVAVALAYIDPKKLECYGKDRVPGLQIKHRRLAVG